MTLSKPPALATWMLEHLALGCDKDALEGDLLEEFGHRRSVGWYWRQVLMAIFVGFSKELGSQWRAAVFALVWTVASVIDLQALYCSIQFRFTLLGWAIRHDWPESVVLSTILKISPLILMSWLGLLLYLVMMGSFSAGRFARGVSICLFCMLLAYRGSYRLGWGVVMRNIIHRMPLQAIVLVSLTPLFLGLLLSFCATLPSAAIKRAARIRISE